VAPLDLRDALRRLAEKILQPRAERLGIRFSWTLPDEPVPFPAT
jgi:hypothetical protein